MRYLDPLRPAAKPPHHEDARRLIMIVGCCALIGVVQAIFICMAADAQMPNTPGAGHGFLIDKHVAAKVSCGKCHTEGITKPMEMATCLGCHGGSYTKLAAATDDRRPNPHASHLGEAACATCHHVHIASVTSCNQCHTFDMTTP